MSGVDRANGHKPEGLYDLFNLGAVEIVRPDPADYDFDLEDTLSGIVALNSRAPEDAFSSSYLGTERVGNAVLLDDATAITIGYLVTEVDRIVLTSSSGQTTEAFVVAYDYTTGFGVIRLAGPLDVQPLEIGLSEDIAETDTLIAGAGGGLEMAIKSHVVSIRDFAGYWEYTLDDAIFTAPPHPAWSGAGLLNEEGKLVAIGYLYVQDAIADNQELAGNMWLPIDKLKPIYDKLLQEGKTDQAPRPWLGIYSVEHAGQVVITSITEEGPADTAGVEAGDVVVGVNGERIDGLHDMYHKVWATGDAGVPVKLTMLRGNTLAEVIVDSVDREKRMRKPRAH